MPTSTNLAKYPQGMLDILESVCETKQPADIAYKDQKLASAERLRFYGLIKALHVNDHSLAERAARLTLVLAGVDPKNKNILTIKFPDSTGDDAFYAGVAAKLPGLG